MELNEFPNYNGSKIEMNEYFDAWSEFDIIYEEINV